MGYLRFEEAVDRESVLRTKENIPTNSRAHVSRATSKVETRHESVIRNATARSNRLVILTTIPTAVLCNPLRQ
jgi:hypothetical protein